jgi:hypothetical protein
MVKLDHTALISIVSAFGLFALASCASQSAAPAASSQSGVVNTGAYPNINIVPTGETAQLTDSEAEAKKAELTAQGEAQRQNGESAAAYLARLRRLQQLGSTHAAAALAAIEASQ